LLAKSYFFNGLFVRLCWRRCFAISATCSFTCEGQKKHHTVEIPCM